MGKDDSWELDKYTLKERQLGKMLKRENLLVEELWKLLR